MSPHSCPTLCFFTLKAAAGANSRVCVRRSRLWRSSNTSSSTAESRRSASQTARTNARAGVPSSSYVAIALTHFNAEQEQCRHAYEASCAICSALGGPQIGMHSLIKCILAVGVSGHLGQVGASLARELVPRVVIVRADVALDAAHHRQQLAREVRAHVGAQPCKLRVRCAPRVCCRL